MLGIKDHAPQLPPSLYLDKDITLLLVHVLIFLQVLMNLCNNVVMQLSQLMLKPPLPLIVRILVGAWENLLGVFYLFDEKNSAALFAKCGAITPYKISPSADCDKYV